MASSKDLKMIREDLVAELGAINQYQDHIDSLSDTEAQTVLSHIRDDEKEHVKELVELLRKLDPTQDKKFEKKGL